MGSQVAPDQDLHQLRLDVLRRVLQDGLALLQRVVVVAQPKIETHLPIGAERRRALAALERADEGLELGQAVAFEELVALDPQLPLFLQVRTGIGRLVGRFEVRSLLEDPGGQELVFVVGLLELVEGLLDGVVEQTLQPRCLHLAADLELELPCLYAEVLQDDSTQAHAALAMLVDLLAVGPDVHLVLAAHDLQRLVAGEGLDPVELAVLEESHPAAPPRDDRELALGLKPRDDRGERAAPAAAELELDRVGAAERDRVEVGDAVFGEVTQLAGFVADLQVAAGP